MKIFFRIFHLLPLVFLLAACEKLDPDLYSGMGKRPIYVSNEALRNVKTEAPQAIMESGTIFLRDSLLFLLDQGRGVHVFDISDTLNTQNLAFLKIPAVNDFIVYGQVMYANCWRDLVVIDISNLQAIQELDRLVGALEPPMYPQLYNGIFECVDDSKGAVLFWEDAMLEDVACRTTN
jgi:hypothetical protein